MNGNKPKIADIVAEDVYLRSSGRDRLLGLCPFHREKTPSFEVSNEMFHCYGCKAGGDVIEYIKLREGVEFIEACKILGIDAEEEHPLREYRERRKAQREEVELWIRLIRYMLLDSMEVTRLAGRLDRDRMLTQWYALEEYWNSTFGDFEQKQELYDQREAIHGIIGKAAELARGVVGGSKG